MNEKNPQLSLGFVSKFGAGKGTVINYLVQKYGFYASSCSDRIREEIQRQGKEITRERLQSTAGWMRENLGAKVLAKRTWMDILKKGAEKAAIDSIRSMPEVEFFRTIPHFYLISIEADPKIRFARMVARAKSKGRADPLTWEEFTRSEERDDTQDGRNIAACMQAADFSIKNNGPKNELFQKIDELLLKII